MLIQVTQVIHVKIIIITIIVDVIVEDQVGFHYQVQLVVLEVIIVIQMIHHIVILILNIMN